MADDPLKTPNNGKLGPPPISAGMNKIASAHKTGGKGAKDDKDDARLGLKQEEHEKLLERARKRMDRAIAAESDNRKSALDDIKFYAGQQWPSEIMAQRNFDQRPCLTINKLPTLVNQVTNDVRQNRPDINVSPVGDRSDPEVAKMYAGLIREIERKSVADIAYDTAFAQAARCGWGHWRVVTEYEKPNSLNQVLTIKRIRNQFTVYMDNSCQEPDGSDAKWCFISEDLDRDEFKEDYPDAQPMPWTETGIGDSLKAWVTKDKIRVAEYYEIVNEKRWYVLLENGAEGWEDEFDDDTLNRYKITGEREADWPKIKWYKLTAVEVLDERDVVGKWIPVVRVLGDEVDIEGKPFWWGIVRQAKDAQKAYNYWTPLSLDTPIPTPRGWKNLRDVHAGDEVFDEMGFPVSVVGESPVFINRECFEITFDDGSSIIADGEHPWQVERGARLIGTRDWKIEIRKTSELKPKYDFIYTPRPLQYPEADLPLNPYVLGVWLGDGTSSTGGVTQGIRDVDAMKAIIEECGYEATEGWLCSGGSARVFTVKGIKPHLAALGVLNNKHIPDAYLRASEDQRWALLQGLMDTDGSIHTKLHQCIFTTTSERLGSGFEELAKSLGLKLGKTVRHREMSRVMPAGVCNNFLPEIQFRFSTVEADEIFRLPRKRKVQQLSRPRHWRRTKRFGIKSIVQVASRPVKCIAVAGESHLFLAGNSMVPTHNTSFTEAVALAPKSPWLIAEGQDEGYEQEFKNANRMPMAVIRYKPVTIDGQVAPPPTRLTMNDVPQGIQLGLTNAGQDMMATTGIRFDGTVKDKVYDESGRALRELRRFGDLGSFHLVDNLARALRHTGEILIASIPEVYDEKRVATILRENDVEEQVIIDPHATPEMMKKGQLDKATGKTRMIFNPTYGEYGVTVTIGPSYATKRIEAAESMMDFLRAVAPAAPQAVSAVLDLVAKNQDWPGADEFTARLSKLVAEMHPGIMQPNMKDVPPEAQALLMGMQAQLKKDAQERVQMMQALTERQTEFALRAQKQEQDFEAKLLAIAQKEEASGKNFGSQFADLAKAVTSIRDMLSPPSPETTRQ